MFSADNMKAKMLDTFNNMRARCSPLGGRSELGPPCSLHPVALFDDTRMWTNHSQVFGSERKFWVLASCYNKYLAGGSSDGKVYLIMYTLRLAS